MQFLLKAVNERFRDERPDMLSSPRRRCRLNECSDRYIEQLLAPDPRTLVDVNDVLGLKFEIGLSSVRYSRKVQRKDLRFDQCAPDDEDPALKRFWGETTTLRNGGNDGHVFGERHNPRTIDLA